ncbi:hypothetical protein [Helicobacter pullorum]|uniref:hypothetical protein n=1 Tax=Helicobacter pullorum TaxID=35818 RepID=UPI0006CCCB66|nr:hypothetical protein [Helicobacter pullorum]KPH50983.1 hypothetical protein HPU229254_07870 [Helicobacter pullorum]
MEIASIIFGLLFFGGIIAFLQAFLPFIIKKGKELPEKSKTMAKQFDKYRKSLKKDNEKYFIGVELYKTTPKDLKELYGNLTQDGKGYTIANEALNTSENYFVFNYNDKLTFYTLIYESNDESSSNQDFKKFINNINLALDYPKKSGEIILKTQSIKQAFLIDNENKAALLTQIVDKETEEYGISIYVSTSEMIFEVIKNLNKENF